MIHVLNNLPDEYDVILNGLENHLMATGDDALMINSIRKKRKLKVKKKEKAKEKKHWVHIINNTNSNAGDVESMATNLAMRDTLKRKMKKEKIIRIRNIKHKIAVKKGI